MNNEHFPNAPNIGRDFLDAERVQEPHEDLPHDAERWEAWDDEYREQPSEKHYTMEYTPGGSLEQEVHQQIDSAARDRIARAELEANATRNLPDEKELDFAGDFDDARRNSLGFDPESAREYEEWTRQQDAERVQDLDAILDDFHRSDHDQDFER